MKKRKLTRKQTLIIGITVGLIEVVIGIVASLWIIIIIGIATLLYTFYLVTKTQ